MSRRRLRRLSYALLLAAALCAWLFVNQAGTRLILAGLLALPLLSGAGLPFIPRRSFSAAWEAPPSQTRGEDLKLGLVLQSQAPLGAALELKLRGTLAGRASEESLGLWLPARGRRSLELQLRPDHCGKLLCQVAEARLTEPFGLFTRSLRLNAAAELTILPKLRPMELWLGQTGDFLRDSEAYSTARPGYDPSETFRLRAYVPGDPIRQIHWKLSEKTDQLLVRDLGLPIVSQLLFLFDSRPADPAERDLLLDCLASAALCLCDKAQRFDLGWVSEAGTWELRAEIDGRERFFDALTALLGENPAPEELSPVEALLGRAQGAVYAHVALFASGLLPEAEALERGNRVTVLVPAEALKEDPSPKARVRVLGLEEGLTELEL